MDNNQGSHGQEKKLWKFGILYENWSYSRTTEVKLLEKVTVVEFKERTFNYIVTLSVREELHSEKEKSVKSQGILFI